jgi:hypothetical protein
MPATSASMKAPLSNSWSNARESTTPPKHTRPLADRDGTEVGSPIAVISALVANNVIDQRLDFYIGLARRNGLDDEGLSQLMILLTAYIGQPYPSAAMQAVRRTATAGGTGPSVETRFTK